VVWRARYAVWAAVVLVVVAIVWLVWTGIQALGAVTDLRSAVVDLEEGVESSDVDMVREAAAVASEAAQRADAALGGPVWGLVAAVPYLGDTAEVARKTANAAATAATGLEPVLDQPVVLQPRRLYDDGRFDLEGVAALQAPLAEAADAAVEADALMASVPTADSGGWVPGIIDDERARAAVQLRGVADAMVGAAAAAEVMPTLLGAEGPRTWFVGVQSPAEARGTGGVIGTHVILTADDGRLEFERSASNSELRRLDGLPDFGPDYAERYLDFPEQIANTNLSPHFPYAGRLWWESYAQSVGDEVDVVMGTDVVSLGDLIRATGPVQLPDGRTVRPAEAVEFGLIGVYEEFADQNERERYQEDVAEAVFTEIAEGDVDPGRLVTALGRMAAAGRLLLWSPVDGEQDVLARMPTSGSVAPTPGPSVQPVVLNSTESKLDTYLDRRLTYTVERCDIGGRMPSTLEVTLVSDIPEGADLPEDVLGKATLTPEGPESTVQLQVHTSEGAALEGVTVDGEPVDVFGFEEQGRPAFAMDLTLRPRQPTTVVLSMNEPTSTRVPEVVQQPLARPAEVTIVDGPCLPPEE
jgi:hypothetical protein